MISIVRVYTPTGGHHLEGNSCKFDSPVLRKEIRRVIIQVPTRPNDLDRCLGHLADGGVQLPHHGHGKDT